MRMPFINWLTLASGTHAQRALYAMRFSMGLGWGLVMGLALGFVLCWGVVQRTMAPAPLTWRTTAAAKPTPSGPPAQTLAKAQTGR